MNPWSLWEVQKPDHYQQWCSHCNPIRSKGGALPVFPSYQITGWILDPLLEVQDPYQQWLSHFNPISEGSLSVMPSYKINPRSGSLSSSTRPDPEGDPYNKLPCSRSSGWGNSSISTGDSAFWITALFNSFSWLFWSLSPFWASFFPLELEAFWRLETRAGLVMSLLFVGLLLLGGVVGVDPVNGVDVVSVSDVGDRGVRVGDVGLAGKAGFSGEVTSGKIK